MYLDESGDHVLDKIDPDYPVFVLGGVIVDRAHARTEIETRVRELKREHVGREDIVLHTADIIRAKNDFACLRDPARRSEFYAALNAMMRELDYEVVACVIKKVAHLARFGANPTDPYMHSLGILVERFISAVGNVPDGGLIVAEKRRPDLDHDLDLAWERLKITGTGHVWPQVISEQIVDLSLKDKRLNIAALQLADLVVSPVGRAMIGKPTHEDWEIVKSKFRRVGNRYEGVGLVVSPK